MIVVVEYLEKDFLSISVSRRTLLITYNLIYGISVSRLTLFSRRVL